MKYKFKIGVLAFCLPLIILGWVNSASATKITVCTGPVSIIGNQPTLNWTTSGDTQSGYQVYIYNSVGSLIYDSGMVLNAAKSVTGPVLAGGTYSWAVRVLSNVAPASWTPFAGGGNFSIVNNSSCVSLTAPDSVAAGQPFSASVVMNNIGTKLWNSDATPHRLGSDNPIDNLTWGLNRINLPSATDSGSSATFNFTATAPATVGSYSFSWKMVEDGIEWFGAVCAKTINTVGPKTLFVTKSGLGTVTSAPAGIDCGSTCSANYDYNTSVTLTATPAVGYLFTGWSGDCSGAGTCVVSMTADRAVTATFTIEQKTLFVTKSGLGTVTSVPAGIDCGSTCSANYDYNTSVTLTATPAVGYLFT
ncbi:hypothetical protein KJ866_03750, partial [Patescibacteria group bacterium]|nr:hypothetical protein [Patescibacteria group bacterium]